MSLNKLWGVVSIIIGIVVLILVRGGIYALNKYAIPGLVYTLSICAITGVIGYFLTNYLIKKYQTTNKLGFKVLLWSNIISWFIPLLGTFTAGSTFRISEDKTKHKDWFQVIAILVIIASLINAVIGLNIRNQENHESDTIPTNSYNQTPSYTDDDPANLFNDEPPINPGSDDPLDLFED